MKKLFSGLFAVVGTILMAGTAVLCLFSLNATPKILEFPQEATQTVQAFATALSQGDLENAGAYIYGQPELTVDATWEDETKNQIWQAYLSSLNCAPAKEPLATDEGIDWTVQLSMMDLSAFLDTWQQQANAQLAALEEQTADQVQQILNQSLSQTLAAEHSTVSQEITLHLIYRDDRWWISADSALLQILSGQA